MSSGSGVQDMLFTGTGGVRKMSAAAVAALRRAECAREYDHHRTRPESVRVPRHDAWVRAEQSCKGTRGQLATLGVDKERRYVRRAY